MNKSVKKFGFVFPGQGSQKVGMGKDLYKQHKVAKYVFDEIDESLKFKLSKIIFSGPEAELTKTKNTQPALMAVSVALSKVLEHESKKKFSEISNVICGHSLGEYSALCAADVISIKDAAILLKTRGEAMQESVKSLSTKMVAILGLDLTEIENIISESNDSMICDIANDNCPGQIVLSGHCEKVNEIAQICLKSGARRVVPLNVSAPFHCNLMKPASEKMKEVLESVEFKELKLKFISNYDAVLQENTDMIKNLLVKQISSRVRWREIIEKIKLMNLFQITEIGSGKVLTGLNKRMNVEANLGNIETIEDIDNFLEIIYR